MFGSIVRIILYAILIVPNCSCLNIWDDHTAAVTQIVQNVVEKYNNNLSDINNAKCVSQLRAFLVNLFNSTSDDIWALKMIDATGRLEPGLLEFNVAWVGRFDECLRIESPLTGVKGSYCHATIAINTSAVLQSNDMEFQEVSTELMDRYYKQLKSSGSSSDIVQLPFLPSLGICVPDQCASEDVQTIISELVNPIPISVNCQTKENVYPPLDTGAIITLIFFAIFISFMTLSTIYDLWPRNDSKSSHIVLKSFSVYTNLKKLLKVSKKSGEFECLNGIKVLSMMWVVFGHLFYVTLFGPLTNLLDIIRYLFKTESLIITNAVNSVDTFFVVGGMLAVYNYMKTSRKSRPNLIKHYLHRYIRLTPALIPVLLVSIYLTKYIGSGPFHSQLDWVIAEPCRKNWWSVLLYVQNYVLDIKSNVCIAQSWYLDVDFQMYALAPIFLIFLPKRPLIGLVIMACGLIGSMLAGFFVTWTYKLEALMGNFYGNLVDFNLYYYFLTHTRAATWLIGAFLGYFMAKLKFEKDLLSIKLPKWLVAIVWLIVLTTIPACIFAGHDTLISPEYHPYSNAFYNSFARPAWALCISWIIFACSIGYGGIINTILSWPLFQVLNRLTYSIYLVHLTTLYIIALSLKQPRFFSRFNIIYDFWGALGLNLALAVFWVLAFELPIIELERYLLPSVKATKKQKTEIHSAPPTAITTAEP